MDLVARMRTKHTTYRSRSTTSLKVSVSSFIGFIGAAALFRLDNIVNRGAAKSKSNTICTLSDVVLGARCKV